MNNSLLLENVCKKYAEPYMPPITFKSNSNRNSTYLSRDAVLTNPYDTTWLSDLQP